MRRIFSRSFVCSSIGVRNAAAYARRPSSADRTAKSDPQVTTKRSSAPGPPRRQGSPEVTWLSSLASTINNVPLTAERFHAFTRSPCPMPRVIPRASRGRTGQTGQARHHRLSRQGNEAPGATWRVKSRPLNRNWGRGFSLTRVFAFPRLPHLAQAKVPDQSFLLSCPVRPPPRYHCQRSVLPSIRALSTSSAASRSSTSRRLHRSSTGATAMDICPNRSANRCWTSLSKARRSCRSSDR